MSEQLGARWRRPLKGRVDELVIESVALRGTAYSTDDDSTVRLRCLAERIAASG